MIELTGAAERWEADVLLSDGGAVHIRPAGHGDGPGIVAMHERMSDRTKYLRYFSATKEISPAQLRVFTEGDNVNGIGLVAELGGRIIAAGTCHRDPRDPQSAEVAFVVEDAEQKRGLGSILLEHLAAAAAEVGIRRFTAEVLAENQQMVRVFVDAGYAVNREFSSGIIDLVFDIAPTERSRSVVQSREHRAEARSLSRLLSPRSVAVIGASADPGKVGHAVLANLLRAGFTGPVYPVNPDSSSVQDVPAYQRVTDIPGPVDLAVVAVPTGTVADVVEGCRAKGVHGLVVVTGGFADAGSQGAQAQRTLVRVARANGMRVLGPNCLGLMNTDPAVRLNATLAPVVPGPGRVGFFCQSGALGIAILADAAARGLGLSSFVSAGNRADVSGNDLLQFWHSDERTEVVLLYLESFGNPRKFARLARVLARAKPVIAVKSGRHALVSDGLAASTAPLSTASVGVLFGHSGVIRTDTLSDAFDVAQLLANQSVPRGNRVAVLGNSTALGILAVDASLAAGLVVSADAPIDVGVGVSPAQLAQALQVVLQRDDIDAVVVVFVPPVAVDGRAHASALRDVAQGATVPVLTTFLAVDGLAEQLTVTGPDGHPARGSLPSFRTPERAVAALAHAVRYGRWLARPPGDLIRPHGIDAAPARRLIDRSPTAGGQARAMTDDELVEMLGCYGIPVAGFRAVDGSDEAVRAAHDLGFPVVVKAAEEFLRHRLDQVGVRLRLRSDAEVQRAVAEVQRLGARRLYVQRLAPPEKASVPTVFGVTADPSFGALISFGIGGVATELLDDRVYRAVPLTDADAADLIDEPRAAPLLTGYRGAAPVDRGALADLALRLSALADDLPEVLDLALNPVLCGPGGISVTGASGRVGGPGLRPGDGPRRLR